VITQLAVHRGDGTVEVPEVMIVPRLAGLPVPSVGEIAVGGLASAFRKLDDENGTRLKKRRTTTRREMQDVLIVTGFFLMVNPSRRRSRCSTLLPSYDSILVARELVSSKVVSPRMSFSIPTCFKYKDTAPARPSLPCCLNAQRGGSVL
jgi:hypothetical protein